MQGLSVLRSALCGESNSEDHFSWRTRYLHSGVLVGGFKGFLVEGFRGLGLRGLELGFRGLGLRGLESIRASAVLIGGRAEG